MRFRGTVVLLIIALGIGAYIYFYERKMPTTDEAKDLEERVLHIKSDDVEKIQLAKGDMSVTCEKKIDGTWDMTHPLKTKADDPQVQGIISRVESLRQKREIELKAEDVKEFGLEEPRAKLGVWHGDTVTEIAVGDEAPLGDNIYIRLNEEPVAYLVAKGFFGAIDKSVDDLRDKTIIDVAVPAVSRMKIVRNGGETEAVKEGDHWMLISPARGRADDDKATGILNKLKSMRAVEFVTDKPEDLEVYGLSSPPLEIALFSGEDMAAKKIAFGKVTAEDSEKVYVKREGVDTVYAVRKSVVDTIGEDIGDLRSKKLFRAGTGDIDGVTVSREEDVLELKKAGGDWKIVKPVEADAEPSRVNKLLADITGAKVSEFIGSGDAEAKKYGLEEPGITLLLQLAEGETDGVAVGKVGKKLCYVRRDGEEAILGVDKQFEKELNADYLQYVKKEVLSFDRGKVQGLTLRRPDGEYICTKDEKGEWSFATPEEGEPSGKKLDSILVRISHLRARDFVAPAGEKLKQYGLNKPRVEAEVELKGGEKHALLIGKKTKDGYYAMVRGGRMIFTVPSAIVESLEVEDIVKKEEPEQSPKEEEKK